MKKIPKLAWILLWLSGYCAGLGTAIIIWSF